MSNICQSCVKYSQVVNPCLGVRGFDGHYTWGTPIHQDDLDQYPSYVMDGAQSPDKPEDCFAFESFIPDADRFQDDGSYTDEWLAKINND